MYSGLSQNLTFLPHGVVLCLNLPTTLFKLYNILSNFRKQSSELEIKLIS